MITDSRLKEQPFIIQEMTSQDSEFWFSFKRHSFIHNIDTFYYSVKLVEDFVACNSYDDNVNLFREYMDKLRMKYRKDLEPVALGIPNMANMYYTEGRYDRYYTVHIVYPDLFDLFIAPRVPPAADGGASVTPEIIVQLRSYNLWVYGIYAAFENSYAKVKQLLEYFGLTVSSVTENRVDYCWHTNYFDNPSRFFTIKNFYAMKVSRFRGSFMHASNVGQDDYELDYIAMGKRGDKCFVRIYLKSKEVIQKGYKQYFLKAWLFQGLINRYDLYCLEYAFLESSWKALVVGRLKFYAEYGTNVLYRKQCEDFIRFWNDNRKINDAMLLLADLLTPRVHSVINVEFQTMRKMSKTFDLKEWQVKTEVGDGDPMNGLCLPECKALFVYLQNLSLIRQYLTHDVLRLVKKSGDSNKSRRENNAFWRCLCAVSSDYDIFTITEKKLLRNYQHEKCIERLKRDTLRKAVTYGLYCKGKNMHSPLQDAFESLLTYNDNDVYSAVKFKKRKIKELNFEELPEFFEKIKMKRDIELLDVKSGALYDKDSISDLLSQEDSDDVSW